jgi:hypothetical protein
VNVNIPTCITGAIRGTLTEPAATSPTGAFNAQDCTSTATPPFATDIDAFLNGFVTETLIGIKG